MRCKIILPIKNEVFLFYFIFYFYYPPSFGITPCVGTAGSSTLDAALLISFRAGADLGWTLNSRV